MTGPREHQRPGPDPNDLLLYLGAAVLAAVGLVWLVLARPWTEEPELEEATPETVAMASPPSATIAALPSADRGIEESLRLAGLARAAGMLVEPPRYSAWALYAAVLDVDPTNAIALDGIERVADGVVARAATALEQGRTADAQDGVATVLGRLPDHAAAQQLAETIEARAAEARSRGAEARAEAETAAPGAAERPAAPAVPDTAPIRVSPLAEPRDAFDEALAAGRLLLPETESAKHFLSLMAALDDADPTVIARRDALVTTLLARADEAAEALDAAAATTWIEEAERVGAAPGRLEQARAALTNRLIAAESQKPVPATELVLAAYTAPRYPVAAANLGIEGWVDVEFVVATDGATTAVSVTDASHDDLFREEATAAVQRWRFEPRIFLDRPIPQKSYTRIRFVLE